MPPPAVQPLKFCDPDPVAGPKNVIVHAVAPEVHDCVIVVEDFAAPNA
jgi:hypothetical protein